MNPSILIFNRTFGSKIVRLTLAKWWPILICTFFKNRLHSFTFLDSQFEIWNGVVRHLNKRCNRSAGRNLNHWKWFNIMQSFVSNYGKKNEIHLPECVSISCFQNEQKQRVNTTRTNFTLLLVWVSFAYDWIRSLLFIIANMIGFCRRSVTLYATESSSCKGHEVSLLFKCRRVFQLLNVIKYDGAEKKKMPAGNKINGFPSSFTLGAS